MDNKLVHFLVKDAKTRIMATIMDLKQYPIMDT
jgi:hypothetical protein